MGAGGKKKNQSFTVAPSDSEGADPAVDPLTGWTPTTAADGGTVYTQAVVVSAYSADGDGPAGKADVTLYEVTLNPETHQVAISKNGNLINSFTPADNATAVAHTEAFLSGYAGILRCGACGEFMSASGWHACPESNDDEPDSPIVPAVAESVSSPQVAAPTLDSDDPGDLDDADDLDASPIFPATEPATEQVDIALVPAATPTDAEAIVEETLAQIATLRDTWWHESQNGYDADDVAGYYEQLQQLNNEARTRLEELGASEDELKEARKALGAANTQALMMLSEEDLAGLGATNGFPHPVLVSQEALAFSLNPAYADSDRIAKVHATAIARYQEMVDTGTAPNGMTLTEYHEAMAALPGAHQPTAPEAAPDSSAPPPLSAARTTELRERVAQILTDTNNLSEVSDPATVLEVLDAYREVAAAKNAGTAEDPELALEASAELRNALNYNRWRIPQEVMTSPGMSAALEERFGMEGAQRYYSNETQLLSATLSDSAYLGGAEPNYGPLEVERAMQSRAWETEANARLNPLYQHVPDGETKAAWPAKLDSDDAVAQAAALASGIRNASPIVNPNSYNLPEGMYPANHGSAARHEVLQASALLVTAPREQVKDWAAQQDLKQLRAVATALGGEDMDTASRAQVTSYLRATVGDMKKGPEDVQAAITAAKGTKATKAAAQQAAKAAALANPGSPEAQLVSATALGSSWKKKPGAPQMDPPVMSFTDVVAMNAAAAQHMHASREPIPARMSAADVAAIPFTPAPNPGLGGAHTKSFHTDPTGTTWMHKPYPSDPNAFGRSEAEAVASQAFTAGGIPAVPVYRTEVGGQVGAMQPLIANTGTMSSNTSTYTQADVDSVVRMHVGTWLVGDHDLHPANVLRTPGGGLVPIDQGQAFKNYGRDKLALDYHPNAKFGEAPPVWQSVYRAAQQGTLAPGVHVRPEVALTVIKEYEKMPDSQWRDMLRPMATSGAKKGAVWVEPMRKRAAKKHGVPESQVSTSQIEDEFLDYATERKRSLRTDFGKFFTSEGWVHAKTIFSVG